MSSINRDRFQSDIILTLSQAVPGCGAYFYEDTGCLCVPADEGTARAVFHTVTKLVGLGNTQISGPVQGEYLIDIV